MNIISSGSILRVPLERPASVRRHLPSLGDDGWMISEFIAGDENSGLRYLFSDSVVADLPTVSPIVFYGEKGSGKTALAITLAVRWARLTRSRPLCFTTGPAFAKDYASAVEIDDIGSFRTRHRGCKLLIIDDLDTLATKPAAQTELANTLDAHAAAHSPVIVSCGRLPATIPGILPPLCSRLSSGYSLPLLRPDAETRAALLDVLIQDIDPSLPLDPLVSFCSALEQPLRIQDLKIVVTVASQNKGPDNAVDFAVVRQLVRQLFDGEGLAVAGIAKVVARYMGAKLTDMRGSTRQASIVRARGVAIVLARRLTSSSLQQIGQFFGGRDHSTVLHSFRKTMRLIESDAELAKALTDIQTELLK